MVALFIIYIIEEGLKFATETTKKCSNAINGIKYNAEISLVYILDVTMRFLYISLQELS